MNNSQKSSWAPLAIGALVVLIILGVVYYYYFRVDKACIENNIKIRFPGAEADLIAAYTDWQAAHSITLKKGEVCPETYNQVSKDPKDTCTVCELKEAPELPKEISDKILAWAATPQGAAAWKAARAATPSS